MKTHLLCLILATLGLGSALGAVPRPLLYPFPENPGPDPLAQVREEALAQFDLDQDGFLDRSEREAIRQATKQKAEARSQWVRDEWAKSGRRRGSRRPPERWLKLYDQNKNKEFDGGEWEKAKAAEIMRVTQLFDKNANGKIDSPENPAILALLKARTLNGYDSYIHRIVAGVEEDEGGGGRRASRWQKYDLNQNGKADPEELQAIRKAEQDAKKASQE